jgi:hypothetical protein
MTEKFPVKLMKAVHREVFSRPLMRSSGPVPCGRSKTPSRLPSSCSRRCSSTA